MKLPDSGAIIGFLLLAPLIAFIWLLVGTLSFMVLSHVL